MMVADRKSARLERLEPRALSRRIVDQLKRVIIAGELRPGDRVLETELAEQLGVSRGPVREAFRQLEQEGLLVSYPHRGTFVATVPEDEIEEVYALRAHLEAHAARRVVVERRDEALAVLGELLDQMLVAASAKEPPRPSQTSISSSTIRCWSFRVSGAPPDLAQHGRPRAGADLRHAGTAGPRGTDRVHGGSHRPIVDAIRTGDPDTVDAAVKQHIHEVPSLMAGNLPAASTP